MKDLGQNSWPDLREGKTEWNAKTRIHGRNTGINLNTVNERSFKVA